MKTGMPGSRMAATKAQREPEGLMIPAGPDQAPMRQEPILGMGWDAGSHRPTHRAREARDRLPGIEKK